MTSTDPYPSAPGPDASGGATSRTPVTVSTLARMKTAGQKIAALTAYDASYAALLSRSGVDVILVGDSLGMVLQGHDSTLPVTVDDMVYHVTSVRAGRPHSLVMADVPFMGVATQDRALDWSGRLMAAGAQMVKLEGGAWLADAVTALKRCGVPVCVHLGLTPQSVHAYGGYRVQGRDESGADAIVAAARTLQQAGADAVLLECVPRTLARRVLAVVSVPVIGIGAAPECDGQVLVLHDVLGVTPGRKARFVRDFMTGCPDGIDAAVAAYVAAVKGGTFPADEHCF